MIKSWCQVGGLTDSFCGVNLEIVSINGPMKLVLLGISYNCDGSDVITILLGISYNCDRVIQIPSSFCKLLIKFFEVKRFFASPQRCDDLPSIIFF
jgi:hypothetical protein